MPLDSIVNQSWISMVANTVKINTQSRHTSCLIAYMYVIMQGPTIFVQEIPKGEPATPITQLHYSSWAVITAASLSIPVLAPSLGLTQACSVSFLLGCTVGGFMAGLRLPEGVKKVFHPLIACALSANIGILMWSYAVGGDYWTVLKSYLAKVGVGY